LGSPLFQKGGNDRGVLDRRVTSDPTNAVAPTPDSPTTRIPTWSEG